MIKVPCPDHGEVEILTEQFRIDVNPLTGRSLVSYDCPLGHTEIKECPEEWLDLIAREVPDRIFTLDVPDEIVNAIDLSQKNEPLTLGYLLDIFDDIAELENA